MATAWPIEKVVSDYNANAYRIPRLWARADATFTLRKKPGELGFNWSSRGLLLLNKSERRLDPQDFVLLLREAGQEVGRFGISTADKAYYVWFQMGDKNLCRYGLLPFAGAPGIAEMPIDPTQLPGALCICELPHDQTRAPFVAQSVSGDPCAYVLTYIDRQPISNKLLLKREIYFDRLADRIDGMLAPRPCRPFLMKIYDSLGRKVLTAEMKDYQQIMLEDVKDAAAPAPVMPTDIRLTWHETGSEMHLKLSEMTTADKVDPAAFLFWKRLNPAMRSGAKQVDAGLLRSRLRKLEDRRHVPLAPAKGAKSK
jgi:hypothetical protein